MQAYPLHIIGILNSLSLSSEIKTRKEVITAGFVQLWNPADNADNNKTPSVYPCSHQENSKRFFVCLFVLQTTFVPLVPFSRW